MQRTKYMRGGFGRIGIGRFIPVLGLSHLEYNFSG